ncbi:rhoptry protein ROP18 [Besnoitia besnoiti]|uniref:Rhoptry protein ROP18 n=1 Tax=Besnoitia besnoiti TaxID=94643 RepID=A0A2A9M525_BESBE|nr:rhoptry protein ROP18 [Besnoitia besnoiti]PFH31016.1 rhoptry protein ROP18 [Besnoitia besnoiti]
MVFDPKRARKASCRVWLALAALGTVLGCTRGGSRLEEPGSSSDASFADLGQPEGADLALVHGIEPGDSIVKHLLTLVSKQIHPVDRQAGAFRTLDKGLSATFWPQDVTVEVVSVRTGAPRRLRRGPVFGRGDFGMVFTASDVDTGAEFAAKVPIALREPFKMSQEDVMAEGRLTDAFATVKDPREAQAVLRFLVPTDMVQFSKQGDLRCRYPWLANVDRKCFLLDAEGLYRPSRCYQRNV